MDLPKSLRNIFNEGEEEEEEEEEKREESQMEEGEDNPSQNGNNSEEYSEPMEEERGGANSDKASGSLDETWGDISIHTRGEEEGERGGGGSSMELQMNWNLCTYLPEAGSCQNAFQVLYKYV